MVGRRATTGRALTTDRGDPGLFGPDSEAWRLDREAMLLLGAGPRALLLQIAHPLVAAGVADHSNFREDPWRRLDGTLRSYLTIVYGSTRAARTEIRRLNELHRGITGPGYTARDPELSLWVHATLIESTLAAYDAWLEPLSRDRRARFYEETKHSTRTTPACSIPTAPCTRRRSRASWRGRSCGPRWRRWRSWPRPGSIRRSGRSSSASRSRPTRGRSGRRSGCYRRPFGRNTASPGGPAGRRSAHGWSRDGRRGAR
jgi:uncharacterized protein (DUF2236 family)